MNELAALAACAGRWTGTNILQDPHNDIDEHSTSTAVVTPVLGGRFVRIDYTWSYHGDPHEGSMLVGFEARSGAATLHWIDSWHNQDVGMVCRGTKGDEGAIDVRGSYPAPPGPDWGWRTVIQPAGEALRWTMYNVTPEGEEVVAVEETLERV